LAPLRLCATIPLRSQFPFGFFGSSDAGNLDQQLKIADVPNNLLAVVLQDGIVKRVGHGNIVWSATLER
jgi:hypothetical protein